MDLSYAFAIFFITLGPLRILPAFYKATLGIDEKDLHKVSIRAVCFSLLIILGIALLSHLAFGSWRVSVPAFTLAGGIILFATSYKMISKSKATPAKKKINTSTQEIVRPNFNQLALSPVSVPIIISPIGVVAVLVAVGLTHTVISNLMEVVGVLLFIFVLNLVSMWFVRPIIHKIGIPAYSLIGWVFSIMQAGLAIQFIVNAIHKLFPI